MSEHKLTTIDFHGNTLMAILGDAPETSDVVMKPIVEGMNLDWNGQYKKLLSHPVLATCISVKEIQLPGDVQSREVTCLRLDRLHFWLATIHPERIKNKVARDRVIQYQTECANVLFKHFFGKVHQAAPKAERVSYRSMTCEEINTFCRWVDTAGKTWPGGRIFAWNAAGVEAPDQRHWPAWAQQEMNLQPRQPKITVSIEGGE